MIAALSTSIASAEASPCFIWRLPGLERAMKGESLTLNEKETEDL
jgi:hypothetical protein